MNASKNTTPKQDLAAGILSQARRDLRRFHRATRPTGRELYLDAHDWILSEDCRWPFSFRNVCELLNLPPEGVRQELLEDVSLGVLHYWSRRIARVVRRVPILVGNAFTREVNPQSAETGTLVHRLS
jgi:hypothetical protein